MGIHNMSKRGDSRAAGKVRRSNSLCLSLGGVCEVVARGKSSLSKLGKRTGKAVAADESSISTIDSAQKEVGTPAVVGEELCLLNGVAASLGSGILGWVIGFGSGIVRLKVEGSRFRTSLQKAKASSKTFGIMGGMYTFTACASRKIRGIDDAITLAIAGCASGIALGWEGGPVSALQSCAGMGAFSWFFDGKRLNDTDGGKKVNDKDEA